MMRAQSIKKGNGKPSSKKTKLRGRSESPSMRRCWKCGKVKNYKRYYKWKGVKKSKGTEETQSIEGRDSKQEKGDMYLSPTSTKSHCDTWLINSNASYHMTPQKKGFANMKSFEGEMSSWEMIRRPRLLDGVKFDWY